MDVYRCMDGGKIDIQIATLHRRAVAESLSSVELRRSRPALHLESLPSHGGFRKQGTLI